jgi:glycerophosphoryl diester phosphodiesterase
MSTPSPVFRTLPDGLSRRHPNILTVAHRGVWSTAPENSIGAIEAAIQLGVEMVELDTQSTVDGLLVLMHDETLDRTTTGTGPVETIAYDHLRRLRLRHGAGGPVAAVTDETVPLLNVALEVARDRVLVNIDTKYQRDLGRVVATVRNMGMVDQVIIKTDVDPQVSRQLVEDLGILGKVIHMPMMRARSGRFADDLRAIAHLRPPMVEVAFSDIADLEAAREELARQDIRLWVNTIDVAHSLHFCDTNALADPGAIWGRLLNAGVGTFQTDRCEELKAYLGENVPTGA